MEKRRVLIVDDEKNIRLTLSEALEPLGLETDTAVNGEEALAKVREKAFGLMLLDLKMPGMDGMQVLRQVRETRPEIRVIIVTAYGTIESAVDAMKLGAVDFLQKPFAPDEVRELVSQVLDRDKLDERTATDYASVIELAKRCVADGQSDAAMEHARKAISIDPSRAEAFNLLGALLEIQGDHHEALKQYRAAVSLDPTYEPARQNLYRSKTWEKGGRVIFGEPENKREGS